MFNKEKFAVKSANIDVKIIQQLKKFYSTVCEYKAKSTIHLLLHRWCYTYDWI